MYCVDIFNYFDVYAINVAALLTNYFLFPHQEGVPDLSCPVDSYIWHDCSVHVCGLSATVHHADARTLLGCSGAQFCVPYSTLLLWIHQKATPT